MVSEAEFNSNINGGSVVQSEKFHHDMNRNTLTTVDFYTKVYNEV